MIIKDTHYMKRKELRLAWAKLCRSIMDILRPVLLPIVEGLNNFLIKYKL